MEEPEDTRMARRRRGMVTSVDEQLAVSRVRGKLFGGSEALPTVGRYEITRRLGQGSMGTVYLARDPDLDRYVALKLYRPRQGNAPAPGADDRLWREAQLLARVSHPNVVAVHEVGRVGHDNTVFVAMEHVHGVNLSMWLEAHPEIPWRRLVELIEGAARGLAAVHDAGILHRDLKPSNVLVGADDRVRVLDFGLARLVDGRDLDPTPKTSPSPADTLVSSEGVVGTPAYMTPEQHENEPSSVSTDVYALCLTLFEALYGHRPFEGKTVHALWKQKIEGDIDWTQRRGKVPRSLRALLRKGLQPFPNARFQNADALARALVVVRRRTAVRFGAAATAALAVGVGLAAQDHYERKACDARSHGLVSSWSDAASALASAFEASDEATRLGGALEKYAAELTKRGDTVCLDGSAPAALATRRWACLEGRAAEFDALVDTLHSADADMRLGARDALDELIPPATCMGSSVDRLSSWASLPASEQDRYRALLPEFTRAQAMFHGGRHAPALALATWVLEESEALGARDLTARAHYLRGRALERLSRYTETEQALELTILAAERAADPALVARAWSALIFTVGVRGNRFEEALAHEIAARAALSRVDDLTTADLALLESAVAATQLMQGDFTAAAKRFERVLEHEPDLTSRRRMALHHDLGRVYTQVGRADEGLKHAKQAHALAELLHGARHPTTARMGLPVVDALRALDRTTEAVARAQQALSAIDGLDDGQDPGGDLVNARLHLALALMDKGDLPAGQQALDALEQDAAKVGLSASVRADILRLRGHAACNLGRRDEGVAMLEDGIGALKAAPYVPAVSELHMVLELARCERDRGDLASATRWINMAEAIQFPGERPAPATVALLEERARVELSAEKVPQDTLNVMARLVRRIDGPTGVALLEVLRAHAAATEGAPVTAKFHAESAQQLLSGADSRRARLLQAEVAAYLRSIDTNADSGSAAADQKKLEPNR